jgi:hypothetical protein
MSLESDLDMYCGSTASSEEEYDSDLESPWICVEEESDKKYEWCDKFCTSFSAQWPFLRHVDLNALAECIERTTIEHKVWHVKEEVVRCFCELSGTPRGDLVEGVFNRAKQSFYI